MIAHHPPEDLLAEFAAGTLAPPLALALAAHVELCAACRADVAAMEAVGGLLLEEIAPVAVSAAARAAVFARLDEPEVPARAPAIAPDPSLPAVLARAIGPLAALGWRRVSRAIEEARLPVSGGGFRAALLRLKPGAAMPEHTHRGREFTLVLTGGYSDGGKAFGPGDFDRRDASDRHQPVVDPDDECLCLVVLDAPIRLTGPLGRFANPFIRF